MPAFGGAPIMGGSMNGPQSLFGTKTAVLSVKDGLTLLPLHSIEGETRLKGEIWPIEISTRGHTHRETRAAIMRDTYFLPRVIGILEAHASLALATFVSGRG